MKNCTAASAACTPMRRASVQYARPGTPVAHFSDPNLSISRPGGVGKMRADSADAVCVVRFLFLPKWRSKVAAPWPRNIPRTADGVPPTYPRSYSHHIKYGNQRNDRRREQIRNHQKSPCKSNSPCRSKGSSRSTRAPQQGLAFRHATRPYESGKSLQ